MISMTRGKILCFDEDPIGLDTKVTYTDQNGVEVRIDMKKFYDLAKKSEDPYFDEWLDWLKNKELTIGGFIISGLDKLAKEFPDEIMQCVKVEEGE